MTKYLIFTIPALIIVLLLALCPQNIAIDSEAFAKPTVPNPSSIVTGRNNATITIHTTYSIQVNAIKQVEPVIRKAILSNINNAIFLTKGSVNSSIPVSVSAKIINRLTNDRVDTTQGIDMTKKLIAAELTNAINAITPNFLSHFVYQPRVTVDNQAICSGIASPTKAACSFTIDFHN
jgi:hypothetical protein